MATHRLPILGAFTVPDSSGNVYFAPVGTQLTLTSADADPLCIVVPDPAGGGDHGIFGRFAIPKNYVGTPKIVARYILDGSPAATANVHLGVQMLGRADNEAYDTALGTAASNTKNVGSGGGAYADEDVVEQSVTITETIAVDDDVTYSLFIDDSGANPYTGNILITGLYFEYDDA